MKLVVVGGSGTVGARLVTTLTNQGHEVVAASPRSGVDAITGEGLAEALSGAAVVVDVSNSPSFDDAAVMKFFRTATRNLLTAEAAAGVGHHVALSVVGTGRLLQSGYLRAKFAQEKLIKNSQPAPVYRAPIARAPLNENEFRVSEVPPGSVLLVGDLAVFNVDGGFCATQGTCTHRQGALSEGTLDGSTVTCPLHGAQFNIWTGAVLRGPAREPLETYEVVVDGDIGRIHVCPATVLAAQQPRNNPALQTPHQESRT